MIDVSKLREHLNITSDDDDRILAEKLESSSQWISQFVENTNIDAAPVKEAILQLAATLYEQREAIAPSSMDLVPFTVLDLIEPYRVRSFG